MGPGTFWAIYENCGQGCPQFSLGVTSLFLYLCSSNQLLCWIIGILPMLALDIGSCKVIHTDMPAFIA
jgi:hypothetical protein